MVEIIFRRFGIGIILLFWYVKFDKNLKEILLFVCRLKGILMVDVFY